MIEEAICMTSCRSKLASEGFRPWSVVMGFFLLCGAFGQQLVTAYIKALLLCCTFSLSS